MKKTLTRWATDIWYEDPFIGVWLMPLGFLFSDAVKFRKFLYRVGVSEIKYDAHSGYRSWKYYCGRYG